MSFSQSYLEGVWRGDLLEEGQAFPLEARIKKVGHNLLEITFQCMVSDTTYTLTKATGKMYDDFSIYIVDAETLFPGSRKTDLHLIRNYQLEYNREFDNMTLSGYWQDKEKSASDQKRRMGKIHLKRQRKRDGA